MICLRRQNNQTFKDIECIIIDRASTDGSIEVSGTKRFAHPSVLKMALRRFFLEKAIIVIL